MFCVWGVGRVEWFVGHWLAPLGAVAVGILREHWGRRFLPIEGRWHHDPHELLALTLGDPHLGTCTEVRNYKPGRCRGILGLDRAGHRLCIKTWRRRGEQVERGYSMSGVGVDCVAVRVVGGGGEEVVVVGTVVADRQTPL